jgi:hypothetical protein
MGLPVAAVIDHDFVLALIDRGPETKRRKSSIGCKHQQTPANTYLILVRPTSSTLSNMMAVLKPLAIILMYVGTDIVIKYRYPKSHIGHHAVPLSQPAKSPSYHIPSA